jgi:hypothetical protein
MAKSRISETQFVMGYLGEYFDRIRKQYPGLRVPFVLPTTTIEPIFGADFILQGISAFHFIQFKRSSYFKTKRGKKEIASGVPISFLPYYRFKIYNDGNIPQFDRLRDIASITRFFKTYYCAPLFHTQFEFQQHFWNRNILDNSILIPCKQFNQSGFYPPHFDINDGDEHFMVYNHLGSGYICSKRKKYKLFKPSIEPSHKIIEEGDIVHAIDELYSIFKEEVDKMEIPKEKYLESTLTKLQFIGLYLFTKYNIITAISYGFNEQHNN